MMYTTSTSGSAPSAQGAQTKNHHLTSSTGSTDNNKTSKSQAQETKIVTDSRKIFDLFGHHADNIYLFEQDTITYKDNGALVTDFRIELSDCDLYLICVNPENRKKILHCIVRENVKIYYTNASLFANLGKNDDLNRFLRQNALTPIPKISLTENARKILSLSEPPECKIDYSLLPKEIREYVEYKSKFSSAPDIFILSSLLVTLSVALKNSLYMPKGAYFSDLHPNIWICNIGVSGCHKSTALSLGSEIAMRLQDEAEKAVKPLLVQLKELKDSSDADKSMIRALKERIMYYQSKMTIIPNRITPEAMISCLSVQQGGAFFLDELGAWIESKSKNYLKDFKGLLTEMYDNKRIDDETKTHGRLTCLRPYVSICGVSTLTWLERVLSGEDVESGFFARFLIFYPPMERIVPPAIPYSQEYDYSVNNQIRQVIDYVNELPPSKKMYLSPESKDFFKKFHNQLYKLYDLVPSELHNLIEPFIKRWSPTTLKLAMLFQPFYDADINLISCQAVIGACEIVEHAVKSTLHLLRSTLGESEFQRNCRKILELIAKKGGCIQRKQILVSKRLAGGTKEYDETLDYLLESGQITVNKSGPKNNWIYSLK